MIEATVNGKPVKIETSWDEVSFGKFLKLINVQDYVNILSVLLDEPPEVIKKAEFVGLAPVIKAIQFMQKQAEVDAFPTKLGDYILPKDITYQTVEQFEVLRSEMVKSASVPMQEQTKALAMYAAIYCQPLKGEEFDIEKAQWLAEEFMKYPCREVMSAGSFFRDSLLSTMTGLPMTYLRKSLVQRSRKRVLSEFLRRLGFTRLWTTLRVMWEQMTTR